MTCAGIILAGGRSARMGQNKALLPWRGQRLIDQIADILRQAGLNAIHVSGQVEGFSCIPDLFPQCGPVGGIYSCLRALNRVSSRLLFVPVDLPLLTPETLSPLLTASAPACHYESHPLPLSLIVSASLHAWAHSLSHRLGAGEDLSVRDALSPLLPARIPVSKATAIALTNTNTPQDWSALA